MVLLLPPLPVPVTIHPSTYPSVSCVFLSAVVLVQMSWACSQLQVHVIVHVRSVIFYNTQNSSRRDLPTTVEVNKSHRVRSVKSTITWFLPPFHSGPSTGHGVPTRLFTCRNRQASS